MALTAANVSIVGRVDLPPQFVGLSGQAPDAAAYAITYKLAASEYSSGLLLSDIATLVGLTTVTNVTVTGVNNGATTKYGFSCLDPNGTGGTRVRWLTATTPTDYTSATNDVLSMTVIGF